AYNTAQDALFIFGGDIAGNKIQSDLWKLANAMGNGGAPSWSSVPIAGAAPTPIRGDTSGVDVDTRDMLVFLGWINCDPSSCTDFSDTHAIANLTSSPTWTKVSTSGGAPPARYSHSSVYDAKTDQIIIFGGNATTNLNGDASANLDDLWA